jgi:hypothetical protein
MRTYNIWSVNGSKNKYYKIHSNKNSLPQLVYLLRSEISSLNERKNKEYKRYNNENSLVQLVNIFITISEFVAK